MAYRGLPPAGVGKLLPCLQKGQAYTGGVPCGRRQRTAARADLLVLYYGLQRRGFTETEKHCVWSHFCPAVRRRCPHGGRACCLFDSIFQHSPALLIIKPDYENKCESRQCNDKFQHQHGDMTQRGTGRPTSAQRKQTPQNEFRVIVTLFVCISSLRFLLVNIEDSRSMVARFFPHSPGYFGCTSLSFLRYFPSPQKTPVLQTPGLNMMGLSQLSHFFLKT